MNPCDRHGGKDARRLFTRRALRDAVAALAILEMDLEDPIDQTLAFDTLEAMRTMYRGLAPKEAKP